jgi:hypothetical protein
LAFTVVAVAISWAAILLLVRFVGARLIRHRH